MRTLHCSILLVWLAHASLPPLADAADKKPPDSEEQKQISEALRLTTEAAKHYEFLPEGDSPNMLKLEPRPVLRWSNPVAGTIYGNVFVWTDDGRPEVIASFLKWYSPFTHSSHEFHSLSSRTFTARRDGTVVWRPSRAGVEWKPVPDAPEPAATVAQRLLQLRRIAREFSVHKTDRERAQRTMRLLPQPIYRYRSQKGEVIDGALFVFVQGTDPEVFLLLEAVEQGGKRHWQYALARMNSVQFAVKHRDAEVWRTEILPWSQVTNRREPYTSFKVD